MSPEELDLPPVDPTTGFHRTLNRMGGMSPTLDAFSAAFAEFAAQAPGPVLDVGAAYGVASLAALARGAQVIANDLEPRHLEILASRAPEEQRARLSLRPGAFPDELELEPDSLGAVLLARMLHFLDGPAIERGLAKLHASLRPGGKVFGVAVTPHLKKLQPFAPVYQARLAAGQRWPGMVEDVAAFDPEGAASLPQRMHFLDPEILGRALGEAGFLVERVSYFSREGFTGEMAHDGREAVGFIALKP